LNKKTDPPNNLDNIAENILLFLSAKDKVREITLRLSRDIIRHSAKTIRAIHRQEQDKAEQQLSTAKILLSELYASVPKEHNDLLNAGFVLDAQKELSEASITLAVINSNPIPSPDELNTSYSAYLNGLGEAIGELRRFILDNLRRDNFSRCEEILSLMDEIYAILVTMDFPDAMVHGLRRTTDVSRGILEKTRGDLTMALKQNELAHKISPLVKKRE
jgi:translin